MLRETNHRCANDLQLVVSFLTMQARRSEDAQVRQALTDAADRVAVLTRSRTALQQERQETLETALQQICAALQNQAEPRAILVSLETGAETTGLSATQIRTLALAVNELATNAIKHAFDVKAGGRIQISVHKNDNHDIVVIVDDDGLPFPDAIAPGGSRLGLGLVKRLVASIGGLVIPPTDGTKIVEIRVPLGKPGEQAPKPAAATRIEAS